MKGLALTTAAAALLAAPQALARVKPTFDPATGDLTLTARMAAPGTYAGSCELDGYNVGTSGFPSNRAGKVSVVVPLFGHSGPFTCWIRSDLSSFGTPETAAPLRNGRPAVVTGTI